MIIILSGRQHDNYFDIFFDVTFIKNNIFFWLNNENEIRNLKNNTFLLNDWVNILYV